MRSSRFFGVGLSHSSVINCGFHSHNHITKGMTHELRKIEATDRRCHRGDLAAERLPARDGAGFPGFFRRACARNLSTSASTVAVSERIRSACKTTRSIAETLAGQRLDLKVATAATCWIVAPTEAFQCAIGVMSGRINREAGGRPHTDKMEALTPPFIDRDDHERIRRGSNRSACFAPCFNESAGGKRRHHETRSCCGAGSREFTLSCSRIRAFTDSSVGSGPTGPVTIAFQYARKVVVMSGRFFGAADEYFWVLNLYGGRNSAPKPVLNALHSTGFCVKPKQPRNFSRSTEILDLSFSVHKQSLNAVFSFCQLIVKQHGV